MPPDYVVAMVNGTPLSWADMEKRAMGYLKDDVEVNHLVIPTNRMAEAKEHFRRRSIKAFVFKTVMLEEAAKQKIQLAEMDRQEGLRALAVSLKSRNWTTNDFFMKGPMGEAMMRREFEDGLVIDKLLKQKVRDTLKVSDKEIAESVALLKATNQATRVKLDGIRKQLLDGADFADTARTVSQCPSAKNGGDLGEFTRGKMLKDFEQAAFTQEIGVIGPVIETRFGYHVLKVTARTPATEATATTPAVPATVRVSHILLKSVPIDHKRLTDSIVRTKYKAGVDAYFRDLKSKSKIECLIYPDMTF
ncbi:MAG TPA: peptidylprolyl isomerase [Kiritimatiellia bacterium]|nr:peptidylprolyl isomerase [Kiritimatiellia bacterium]